MNNSVTNATVGADSSSIVKSFSYEKRTTTGSFPNSECNITLLDRSQE